MKSSNQRYNPTFSMGVVALLLMLLLSTSFIGSAGEQMRGNSVHCSALNNNRSQLFHGLLQGFIFYRDSIKPVPGVTVTAVGPNNLTTLSSSTGEYAFGYAGGPYTVTPFKSGDNSGITAYDASIISRYLAGIVSLTDLKRAAADTSNDGAVDPIDASYIGQRVVGFSNHGNTGTWKFSPPSRYYPWIDEIENENYSAILQGEVSDNWIHGYSTVSPVHDSVAPTHPGLVMIALPQLIAAQNQNIVVPITVGELTGLGVVSYQFELVYDPQIIQLQSSPISQDATLSRSMNVVVNGSTPGRLRVAVYGATELSGAGTLLTLRFRTIGTEGSTSPFVFENGMLNEGTPQMEATRGSVTVSAQRALPSRADFDGDGKTDLSVFRLSDANWYLLRSTAGTSIVNWGNSTDIQTPGDFDGDNKADLAVYRPSTGQWFVLKSTDGTATVTSWGNSTDKPVAADFDGDNKADLMVYRARTGQWFLLRSSDETVEIVTWGYGTDVPVPGNYDSDVKTDIAVYRPDNGTWYVLQSSGGGFAAPWGTAGDKPTPADFDGDDKDDLAVYRPSEGNWYVFRSSNQQFDIVRWGNSADTPVPGDYDGDGKDDYAVYRSSTGQWFVLRSMSGLLVANWGIADDRPIPAAYIP